MTTQPEVIVFQDAEGRTVTYLRSVLLSRGETAIVSTRIPAARPSRMVRVSRTGGVARDLVTDSPRLTFECSAPTSVAAQNLAAVCRGVVRAWPRDDTHGRDVGRVEDVGGLAEFPDPLSDQPRYQFTVQVDLRGYAG